jgi:hypothetical protein
MTFEQRIAALEQELLQHRVASDETFRIHQHIGGEARIFQSAVLALVISHPRPDLLGPILENHLARIEAGVVAVSNTEEHLQGSQSAQKLIMQALSVSVERFRTQHGL